jgi:hypothetical protein
MTHLPVSLVAATLAAAAIFAFILDLVKVPVFARLGIAQSPVTHATRGTAKTKEIPMMESGASQPTAPGSKSEVKAVKPNAGGNPDAKTTADLTARIAKRAYELYQEGGRRDGTADQNWEKAEAEVRKDPAKAEPPGGTDTETPSDVPQLVKRVHALYEALGSSVLISAGDRDETCRAVPDHAKQQGRLKAWRAHVREIRDPCQLLGAGMRDQITDSQSGQRSRARRSELRHDQSTGLSLRLDRFANLGGGIGEPEREIRRPGIRTACRGGIRRRIRKPTDREWYG